jgi:hypothetical protein
MILSEVLKIVIKVNDVTLASSKSRCKRCNYPNTQPPPDLFSPSHCLLPNSFHFQTISPTSRKLSITSEQLTSTDYLLIPFYGSGTLPQFLCGNPITISHLTPGGVAPVDKTVTYYTVNNIPGEPIKPWITRNLGACQQATEVSDATKATAGWY